MGRERDERSLATGPAAFDPAGLLSHRAKLERAIARGRTTEAGTALLARIEAELEARRTLRFENAAKNVPPLYRGMRDEDV